MAKLLKLYNKKDNTMLNANDYELSIVSMNPGSEGKRLKKYTVDGRQVIGCFKNEAFEIRFKNNTYEKIQIRISLDGTDICTGEPASTNAFGKMWIVNGLGELKLSAWPETLQGGSRFVFSTGENSVAVNTHGDASALGVIAVAVFTEGAPSPVINWNWYNNNYNNHNNSRFEWPIYNWTLMGNNTAGGGVFGSSGGGTYSSSTVLRSNNVQPATVIKNNATFDLSETYDTSEANCSAAIGAGEHTEQQINLATGLNQPILKTTISLQYKWWDELKSELQKMKQSTNAGSDGFPADKKMLDLSSVPKINSNQAPQKGYRRQKKENFYRYA